MIGCSSNSKVKRSRSGAEKKIRKDVGTLARFIQIFCASNRSDRVKSLVQVKGKTGEFLRDITVNLCADCTKLLLHGAGKRITCPLDPKPKCKRCPTYCYRDGYRERIREVMRFSGAHLIRRGRVDLAIKYFF